MVPARVGRARTPRPLLARRLGLAHRRPRRGGSVRPAGRRLRRLRPHREARADGAAPGPRAEPPRDPLRRRGHPRPLRPRSGMAEVLAEIPPRSSRSSTARSERPAATAPSPGRSGDSRPGTSTSASSASRRSTSARATRSRSSSRSAPSGRPPPARSSSTARFAVSTRRRTSSSWSSATTSRWSAPRPRHSSRPRAGARASTRSRGRRCAGRATRSGCSARRRTAPST